MTPSTPNGNRKKSANNKSAGQISQPTRFGLATGRALVAGKTLAAISDAMHGLAPRPANSSRPIAILLPGEEARQRDPTAAWAVPELGQN
jgi:hypothetical protein